VTTLAVMKARIASELRRDDLTTQIADAINTAIGAYEHERFYWNESRENTFTTVASQPNYSVVDAAFIGLITKTDYLYILIDGASFALLPANLRDLEDYSSNEFIGTPSEYAWYDEQFWLYPTPVQAWSVRVGAVLSQAAPASDGELSNPWMVKAERLIRSRAKNELYLHVIRDFEMAQAMAAAVSEAETQLFVRTTRQTKTGSGRVRAMPF
jgi:hypothetical protein